MLNIPENKIMNKFNSWLNKNKKITILIMGLQINIYLLMI